MTGAGREINEQFARIGKALSSPTRLEILDVLSQAERSVEDLARAARTGVANASGHLQILRRAGLVHARKQGTKVFYRPAGDDVVRFLASLRELAHAKLAEVRLSSDDRSAEGTDPVPCEGLLQLLAGDVATVLDVRPAEEYEAGHIRGARSAPVEHLEELGVQDDRAVVVYSRGRYCPLADEALAILRDRGVTGVRRLEDGFTEWRLAGLPIASGEEDLEISTGEEEAPEIASAEQRDAGETRTRGGSS